LDSGISNGLDELEINFDFTTQEVTMTYMLCRNRVADFARWKAVFASHAEAHREAGLKLIKVWRALDDPNNVFFVFEVASLEKAKAFISNPEAAKAGEASGVLDGEYHFLEEAGRY
jgi:hypothetical protein